MSVNLDGLPMGELSDETVREYFDDPCNEWMDIDVYDLAVEARPHIKKANVYTALAMYYTVDRMIRGEVYHTTDNHSPTCVGEAYSRRPITLQRDWYDCDEALRNKVFEQLDRPSDEVDFLYWWGRHTLDPPDTHEDY